MASNTAVSSIAMALAGKTASVDIPMPRDRDSFAAGPGKSAARHGQQAMLPTPPNSISPSLPPQAFKGHPAGLSSPRSVPAHVDSDIDLQDALDHANSQDQPQHAALAPESLAGLDSANAITPVMLSKHHLPDILLSQGPLAIRHVMGYLTTSVPGFSRIPPARARRLVVSALEGKGSGGEGGGVDGDVIFEKVGWGRWDARRRGQPPADRHPSNASLVSNGSYPSTQQGLQIPSSTPWERGHQQYGTSMAGDSAAFSHSEVDYRDHEDISMIEHEADKMSLDGDEQEYCSSSEAPDDLAVDEGWDEGDATDEEDWAQIGAAALRARSFPNNGGGLFDHHHRPPVPSRQDHGGPSLSALAKSVPVGLPIQHNGFSLPDGIGSDLQERAAVEALLCLGHM